MINRKKKCLFPTTWNNSMTPKATLGKQPCKHIDIMEFSALPDGPMSRNNLPNDLRPFGAENILEQVLDVVTSLYNRPKPWSDCNSENSLGICQCSVWKLHILHQAADQMLTRLGIYLLIYWPIYMIDCLYVYSFTHKLSTHTITYLLPDLITQLYVYT